MSEYPLSTFVEPVTAFICMCVWCNPNHTYKTKFTIKTDRYNHIENSTGMCDAASERLLIEDLAERKRLVRVARENLDRLFPL